MSAPKPTQAEVDALIQKHGELQGHEATDGSVELYAVTRKPSRDEMAPWVNGAMDPPRHATADNNILCACIVWPDAKTWQAVVAEFPGLRRKLAGRAIGEAYPDDLKVLDTKQPIPEQYRAACDSARAKGAVCFVVADGRLLSFRKVDEMSWDTCTIDLQEGRHFEGPEKIALKGAVEPARDQLKEIIAVWPGIAQTAGLAVYDLGAFKGEITSGKLRASSP